MFAGQHGKLNNVVFGDEIRLVLKIAGECCVQIALLSLESRQVALILQLRE